MNLFKTMLSLLALGAALPAAALDSDKEQPAVIDADAVDIDFATGKRVYYGDVKLRQGSIKLDADKLEIYFKDDQLERAIAVGQPAVFSQVPEGKTQEVIGKGLVIYLDEVRDTVTLSNNASLTQGTDSLTGKIIVYNMATDKMQVRSGNEGATRTTKNPEGTAAAGAAAPGAIAPIATPEPAATAPAADPAAAQPSGGDTTAPTEDGGRRPKIVLKPKNAE